MFDVFEGFVFFADQNQAGFPNGRFLRIKMDEGEDYQQVSDFPLVSGRAIQGNLSGALGCGYAIGLKPFAVGNVPDKYLLVMEKAGFAHEGAINGQAPRIIWRDSRY